jgi:hypothetical protein
VTRTETKTRSASPAPKGRTGVSAGQPRWRWDLNPRWTFTHTRFRVLRTHVQGWSLTSAAYSTSPSAAVAEPSRTTPNETKTETKDAAWGTGHQTRRDRPNADQLVSLRSGQERSVIKHDNSHNPRLRWAWSPVSRKSAPGGIRTPNLLIRNERGRIPLRISASRPVLPEHAVRSRCWCPVSVRAAVNSLRPRMRPHPVA